MRSHRELGSHLPEKAVSARLLRVDILAYSRIEWAVEVNPISGWVVAVGKLHGTHFSHNDSTCISQTLYCWGSGVSWWIEIVESSVATTGSQALQIKDIFDA